MNIKKTLLACILASTVIFSFAACSSSQKEEKSEETASAPAEEVKVLKVGTEAGFAPYEYIEGNQVVGVDMDIAAEIAKELGAELEIVNMEFDGALMDVQNGKLDLVAAGVTVTEERQEVMDFSTPYVDSKEVVVVNKETPAVAEATVDALAGKVIGVQQGNIADMWAEDNVDTDSGNIKRYSKFAQAAEDLKNNKIDCILIDALPGQELVAANPELALLDGTVFENNYAVALQKGNSELLETVNKVIEKLVDDGKIDEFTANHLSK